jgi:ubiquinone biosynthesis protein
MPIPRPDLTIKNIKRYRAIAGVFVKYGFGEIVDRLNLRAAFKFGKKILRRKPSPDLSLPERIRLALEADIRQAGPGPFHAAVFDSV